MLIEQDVVQFDTDFLNVAIAKHLRFWKGDLPPEKVPDNEEWKCSHCNFRSKCKPIASPEKGQYRYVPWQH